MEFDHMDNEGNVTQKNNVNLPIAAKHYTTFITTLSVGLGLGLGLVFNHSYN